MFKPINSLSSSKSFYLKIKWKSFNFATILLFCMDMRSKFWKNISFGHRSMFSSLGNDKLLGKNAVS